MKNKQEISQKNNQVISDFLAWEGEQTKSIMSAFLFDLQGTYFSQPGVCFDDKEALDIASRFHLLYELVNGIQVVKK